MAGIYIHIPFCRTICSYCDFFKIASLSKKEVVVETINKEIKLQEKYLGDEEIETVYFGGGTPSVLEITEIRSILNRLGTNFNITNDAEISFEANPDDLNKNYLEGLLKTGINRISIGCQSFDDNDLELLERRHNSKQAINSVYDALGSGFKNISIDLMYGIPGKNNWRETLKMAADLPAQHISAYHLGIEEKTKLFLLRKKGKFREVDESVSVTQFEELLSFATENGYVQYEISNFGREGFFSRHNSNYWKQVKYLGIGPSAHSYNGNSRQWNTSNLKEYTNSINMGKLPGKKEILGQPDNYNDYIMLSLRTMWGVDLDYIENRFSKELKDYCIGNAKKYIEYGMIRKENNNIYLTDQGKLVSDNIISELLFVN